MAVAWGITPAELVSPSRRPHLVQARAVVIHLVRDCLGASWSEAAGAVGRTDHTTAMHAHARFGTALATDVALTARLAWVTAALGTAALAPERPLGAPRPTTAPLAGPVAP